ncbi:hypothetical protein BGX20_007307, partial [Mortierella sp. AD010]
DMKVKTEGLDQEYNTRSPYHHNREHESGPSDHGQGGGLSFIHVGTSRKSQVRARPCRMIVEEESESDAEDLDNPWTPPEYTGQELEIDPPVIGEPEDPNNNRALGAGASGPKVTCLYTQVDFDEDESQREIEHELDLELQRDLEENAESSIHRYEKESQVESLTEGSSRKRKREARSSYSQITEELVRRLIDHWVINMCSVTEAAQAVYMNPRTAW